MLGSDKILALDIGAATIKMAEFQPSKTHGLRLTNFNYSDLGIDPEHEENRKALIVSTIRNALRERHIKSTKVIFSVSGQSVFTRFVKLPPVDESKVVQIIHYEAQQNVPFPIDEVIWDYQLLGSTATGELEVVLLAIKSEIIEDLNDGVESAGLRTEMVDVAPMALYNAVRYNQGDVPGCTMVVDIGARTTNLLFIEGGRVFSRSIPIAGNTITQSIASEFGVTFLEAEQMKKSKGFVALGGAYEEPEDEQQGRISKIIRNVMTRLHAELARSINFYKSQQNGSSPVGMLLSGGSSIIPYTDRFFQEKLPIPIQYFNPFRNVEIAPWLSLEELGKCAHFFGEVVGLGLRRSTECPLEVNLLPKTIQSRKQIEQKRPYLAGAAAGAILIPLCWLAYTQKTGTLKQQQLSDVKREVQSLEKLNSDVKRQKEELDKVKAKADQVGLLIQERSYWPEFLRDINQRLVPGIWIVSLAPTAMGGAANTAAPVGAPGRGFGFADKPSAPPPATDPKAGTESGAYDELIIEGAGSHSDNDLKLVDDFAKNLRESNFFDKSSIEIVTPPNPRTKDRTFTFTLRAKMAKPIVF